MSDGSRVAIRGAVEAAFGVPPPTATKAITDATNAAPIVITATAHGYVTGQWINVASVGGNTNANGIWQIKRLTDNTFELVGSQGNSAYTSGGTAKSAVFDFRFTGEGFKYNLEKKRSAEIRSDRKPTGLVLVKADADGPLNFELSFKEPDALFATALQNLWDVYGHRGVGAVFTGTVGTQNTITASVAPTGASAFTKLKKGQWIFLQGFSDANNNKLVQISKTTAPTTTVIVVEGTPLTNGANGAGCKIHGSRLTEGIIQNSWSFEKDYTDLVKIFPYYGMTPDVLSLALEQGDILNGNCTFKGQKSATPLSATALDTPQAKNTFDIMNSVTGVANIQRDGVTLTESLMSMALSIGNALRSRGAIGSLGPKSIGSGTVDVKGNVEAYLDDGTRFTKHVDNTPFAQTFSILDAAGNGYVFTVTRSRFEDANPSGAQKDTDVTDPGDFQSEYDSAAADADLQKVLFIDRVSVAAL